MRGRGIIGMLAAVLLLAGCGLPVESGPRPLPTGSAAPTASPQEPAEPTPSQESVTLWFVREGMLVPVLRTASAPTTSQQLLDLLVAGPTEGEQSVGIRSAVVSVVTGEALVVTADAAGVDTPPGPPDAVAVVLEPAFTNLLAEEQLLVLGEVVTTLAVPPVRQVLFVDRDGQELGVPTGDGTLANGPVEPSDYADLIG